VAGTVAVVATVGSGATLHLTVLAVMAAGGLLVAPRVLAALRR
jgi:hypothetical protein